MASVEIMRNEWRFSSHTCIECDNSAGLCAEDPYGIIRKEWMDRFSGDFEFSTDDDDFRVDSTTITLDAIVMWNVCFADLPDGEGDFARDALNANLSRTNVLLDEIDAKLSEAASHPTRCFRDWLVNKFKSPSRVQSMLGDREEFSAIEKLRATTTRTRMKNEIHQIKDEEERNKAWRDVKADICQTICEEVEEATEDYRNKFGGSREHACLYCHLNHPCHGCGGNFPVQKFVEANIDGEFTSTTKGGTIYAGRWGGRMGCEKALIRQSGLHLCWSCSCSSALYRKRSIDSHRTKLENLRSMKSAPQSNKMKARVASLEKLLEQKPTPYRKIYVKGGINQGQCLQMRVLQGGTLSEEQPKDCTLPITVEMVWEKADGEERVLAKYTPGSNGTKNGNGCSKENRERILEEKLRKAFEKREKRIAKETKEAERLSAQRLEGKRLAEKQKWVANESVHMDQIWWEEARTKFDQNTSRLELCGGEWKTEYEREAKRYVGSKHDVFEALQFKSMSSFDTLGEYLAKKSNDASDIKKYGKIVDMESYMDGKAAEEAMHSGLLSKDPATDPATVALDAAIVVAKKKMADRRAAYNATQSAKRQKCS